MAGIAAAVGLYVVLYIVLSVPQVQERVKRIGEEELSKLLHTEVSVGRLNIAPFNEVVLHDVLVPDRQGDTLLSVDKIGAGFSIYNLVARRRLVFTYAEVIGLNGHVRRADRQSATNVQFIIDALSPKDRTKPPTRFDLKIYNIVLRRSSVSYDVASEPRRAVGFDPNHIAVSQLRADVAIPRLKNDDIVIELKRLSLRERCGFVLTNIAAKTSIGKQALGVENLRVELPHSLVAIDSFGLTYSDLKNLGRELGSRPMKLDVANCYITPSDLSGFVPQLGNFDKRFTITASLRGNTERLEVPVVAITTDDNRVSLTMRGDVENLADKEHLKFSLSHLDVHADASEIASITGSLAQLSPQARRMIGQCGNVRVSGTASGTAARVNFRGDLGTSLGSVRLNGVFARNERLRVQSYKGAVSTNGFAIGRLLSNEQLLGSAAVDVEVDVLRQGNDVSGTGTGRVNYVDLKGYRYSGIVADVAIKKDHYEGTLTIDDDNLKLKAEGSYTNIDGTMALEMQAAASDISLSNLNLSTKYPGHRLGFDAEASLTAHNIYEAVGSLMLHNISFVDAANEGVHINDFVLTSLNAGTDGTQQIKLNSDFINGEVTGSFDWRNIGKALSNMAATAMPSLIGHRDIDREPGDRVNCFDYSLNVSLPDELCKFLKLPVTLIVPITIDGSVNENSSRADLNLSIPYLVQKNKVIEDTRARLSLGEEGENIGLTAHTKMPLKKGKMDLDIALNAVLDRLDTDVSWRVDRDTEFSGNVNMSALLSRTADEQSTLCADIDINPTHMTFNDTVWQMHPAKVLVKGRNVNVQGFCASCDKQYIAIDGEVSDDEMSQICVDLSDINLDYVFQTLAIDNVMFGGRATGRLYATHVYSDDPKLSTPKLHVEGLAYNGAVLGNTDIVSRWDNDAKAVTIDTEIEQPNGLRSAISCAIFPTMDSLYFEFRTNKVDIRFMKPFMSAFTSDVEGEASGFACLYGNFKRINLYGDILVDRLKMKLDYTNTYYTASGDSIHIVPGEIILRDITLSDLEGHTARLNGWVRHNFFHDASFNFQVTDARSLLCYDVTPELSERWYGHIYGNGAAFVRGEPGVVDIDVNMRTADNSRFSFVLSDAVQATEYNFITFTDSHKKVNEEKELDYVQQRLQEIERSQKKQEAAAATRYSINLMADVTPQAQMVLIMDPVGGDRIKATGAGGLRMTYSSTDDALTMRGDYTLEKGSYNFTLQDIIVREFQIKDGSKISFDGDPFNAKINVTASYPVNANLSDLDESFSTDKDMNRTNVPVHALLKVMGAIAEPEIKFDLEFPTLTPEAYRKVKSVISTDDMMNRQIIYLLTLNRFYTPDYMGATSTRNNELASVASSTISSQLSSVLGQLSENWSISPNFRSDKGDFSDIEVELALSSQLLNNRLLLNGNFGYRDNTMNTRNSNFIGDFDLEYLLTKNGNIRFKAYNHFNDQNYYIKSALTTQGIGVVFKHDFDRLFDFLKKRPIPQPTAKPLHAPADSTGTGKEVMQ